MLTISVGLIFLHPQQIHARKVTDFLINNLQISYSFQIRLEIINCDQSSLPDFVNRLFLDYIHTTFPLFTLIYTDRLISHLSAWKFIFIPDLYIFLLITFYNLYHPLIQLNVLLSSNHFLIFILRLNKYFIATESFYSIQSLSSNAFKSSTIFLTIQIKNLFNSLTDENFEIQFIWDPDFTGMSGNEISET